jgi:carboxyl-terminal processing protease
VQIPFDEELGDGSRLKLTIDKWLTPNGTWIHQKGINPDIYVAQPAYFDVAPLNKKLVLKYDMNNSDVKSMQIILDALNLYPGRVDGYFDNQTLIALKSFQEMQKLPITGEADVSTMNRLEDVISDMFDDPHNDAQLNQAILTLQGELSGH